VVFVTEYAGPFVYPGIDVRYHRLREILAEHGYRDIWTIHDVSADLWDENVGEMLDQTRARMPRGVEVMTWEPSLLPAMRAFAAEGDMPPWFPPGWESRLARPRETVLVLRKGEEILGWARYWPGKPRAGFGPILVLPRARGQGFGARLLLECMVRAREAGAERMEAGWANTGFYTRHGWQITRRYAVLKKELG
jgi:GNAT superfamily N-acetyltransferase